MEWNLSDIEARVLGCLVEKDLATPEYYPLTLNALTSACNQKSNRDPAMALDETEVVRGLDALRRRQLAHQSAEGVRAARYCHNLAGRLGLDPEEQALLAELLLRGPQTLGELRGRAERMQPMGDLDAVAALLDGLLTRDEPLVALLPRQPGRKEPRYAHLLSGPPEQPAETTASIEPAHLRVAAEDERLTALEQEVATLREEVATLRERLESFAAQFE